MGGAWALTQQTGRSMHSRIRHYYCVRCLLADAFSGSRMNGNRPAQRRNGAHAVIWMLHCGEGGGRARHAHATGVAWHGEHRAYERADGPATAP